MHSISDPEPFLHNLCSKSFEYPHANPCTNIVPLDYTSSTKQLENHYIHCTEALEQQRHSKPAEDSQILPMNITYLSQELQNLIVVHQLDSKLHTPINFRTLQAEFALHPDGTFVIHNLRYGCNIGYTGPQFAHCGNNFPSSFQHPSTLDANANVECNKGRILSPFKTPPLPNFRCSGLGLVPKHDGGWHAIHYISLLMVLVSMTIDPEAYTLNYCSVDDAFTI